MSAGRVLAACHDGCYLIKLTGDVRVTLCKTIDDYYDAMFADADFRDVVIDLSDAEGIDSTTLGLLAKLAMKARQKMGYSPVVYCPRAGIARLLASMGFQSIFSIRDTLPQSDDALGELPVVAVSEAGCRDRVIEARRILMGLNEKNAVEFQPLMAALEMTA